MERCHLDVEKLAQSAPNIETLELAGLTLMRTTSRESWPRFQEGLKSLICVTGCPESTRVTG